MRRRQVSARVRGPAPAARVLLLLALVPELAGCLLLSGPRQSSDRTEGGGNVSVQFVSAEGNETRQVQAADTETTLTVTVFARVERGQLRIEILDPQGSVVLPIEGTAEEKVARATVPTDANGILRYRIRATGAQRGGFQILYQPSGT